MVEIQNHVALLSILPQYATAIVQGKKKVEFRKTKFKRNVNSIVFYSSSPVKKILGYFSIHNIAEDHPNILWEKYRNCGAIDKLDFQKYFQGLDKGVAIVIDSVNVFKNPLSLCEINPSISVPQNYIYIDDISFKIIKSRPCHTFECWD